MTTINSQEDFLRALAENPAWREAVRAQLLGEELLQLPARFNAHAERMAVFIGQMTEFVQAQLQFNEQMGQRLDRLETAQTETNQRLDRVETRLSSVETRLGRVETRLSSVETRLSSVETRLSSVETRLDRVETRLSSVETRLDRVETRLSSVETRLGRVETRLEQITDDMGIIKGYHARSVIIEEAPGIANDMGLEYIRTLTRAELTRMAQEMAGGYALTGELRSFRRADLIMETKNGDETLYIAMEISFTADQRDTTRAQRNARFLSSLTGSSTQAAIASVKNDHAVEELIASGAIYWYPIEERDIAAE